MKKKVSVIMPLFNGAKYVRATIDSVLEQTYTNFELLIVDDCSDDNGVEIVESYIEEDKRIKLYKQAEKSGAGNSRNRAISEASGDYIAFLDSDDLWLPEKLEKQIKFMESNNYNFTYTNYQYMKENGTLVEKFAKIPSKISYKENLAYNPIGCLTVIYNCKTLGKIYMPDIRRGQDYGLWLKILKKENLAYGLHENLALYRVRKGSLSKNKLKRIMDLFKIYNKEEGYNKLISLFIVLRYTLYKVTKLYRLIYR